MDASDSLNTSHDAGSFPSGRIYENILINGGNVQLGDTYLLGDKTFKTSSIEQKRSALLGALNYTNSGAKRAQLCLEDIGTESYRWVESTNLFSWLRQAGNPLFHVIGKPASGKSTLMRFLSDSHRVRDQLENTGKSWKVVHYFFDFRSGDTQANNPLGMVKLFIRQLMSIDQRVEQFLSDGDTIARLNTSDLGICIDVLSEVVDLTGHNLCAFIDGLDEYGGNLWKLCTYLETVRHRTGMKMCLASRPEPEILKACKDRPFLVMQDHNRESIQLHIQRRLDEISAFEPDIEALFTSELCEKLVRKADGVILWAQLAMNVLLLHCGSKATTDGLIDRLEDLDPGLGDCYTRILSRVPQQFRSDTALILQLVTVCGPYWNNGFGVLIEAIRFIRMRGGPKRLLGGQVEAEPLSKRLMIFLPNLIQLISPRDDTADVSMSQVTVIHLSLASYLKKTNWIESHLEPMPEFHYGISSWPSFLSEILTSASNDQVFDVHNVSNLWKETQTQLAQIQHARGTKRRFLNGVQKIFRQLHQRIKLQALNRATVQKSCIRESWAPCANLLVTAIISSPDYLSWNGNSLQSSPSRLTSRRRVLDPIFLTIHIMLCYDFCGLDNKPEKYVEHSDSLSQADKLGEKVRCRHTMFRSLLQERSGKDTTGSDDSTEP